MASVAAAAAAARQDGGVAAAASTAGLAASSSAPLAFPESGVRLPLVYHGERTSNPSAVGADGSRWHRKVVSSWWPSLQHRPLIARAPLACLPRAVIQWQGVSGLATGEAMSPQQLDEQVAVLNQDFVGAPPAAARNTASCWGRGGRQDRHSLQAKAYNPGAGVQDNAGLRHPPPAGHPPHARAALPPARTR